MVKLYDIKSVLLCTANCDLSGGYIAPCSCSCSLLVSWFAVQKDARRNVYVKFDYFCLDNGVDAASVYVTDWTFQGVANGTFSVDTFFFLSGLLATYIGLKEMRKRDGNLNVPVMYAYRYLRYANCP